MSKNIRDKKQPKQQNNHLGTFDSTLNNFWKKYTHQNPVHVKLIDLLVLQLICIIGVQIFYRLVIGEDFPKNAFLSGTMCPLGVIMLLITIRTQEKNYRALGQFLLAILVLFMNSNIMGGCASKQPVTTDTNNSSNKTGVKNDRNHKENARQNSDILNMDLDENSHFQSKAKGVKE